MQGVPTEGFDSATDRAEYKHLPQRAGVELYRAHIVRHTFEPHTHAAFGLGAIESGAERFRYRGSELLAPPDSLVLMNPDELHTGRAETAQGWRYRMLYLDEAVLAQISGDAHWHFTVGVAHDAPRARRVGALLQALWAISEPLAVDSLLVELVDLLRPLAHVDQPAAAEGAQRFNAVIDFMHAHLAERLTLEQLAAVAGLSPFHFLRRFRDLHHATPQQMLMALRLLRAKQRLAAGDAPADVAADVGLTDQAHLNRCFVRRYGVTPGRYRQQTAAQFGTRRRAA